MIGILQELTFSPIFKHKIRYFIKFTQVDETYKDRKKWNKMSIQNAIRSGKFSSDRTIKQYAEKVWGLEPCKVLPDADVEQTQNYN